MKKSLILLFLFVSFYVTGQEKQVKKPEYVIIANNRKIITKKKLFKLGSEGLVKSMRKGVSKKRRDKLAAKFGDKIGHKEFIVLVQLYTQAEKDRIQKIKTTEPKSKSMVKNNGFKVHKGEKALDFSVKMTDGKTLKLSDLKGKIIILDFWATWCAPCLMEFYDIHNKILVPFKNPTIVFLPISRGESKDIVKKKLKELTKKGLKFDSGLDPEKKIWDIYASGSIPKTLVIDQTGIIKATTVGASEENILTLKDVISKLLSQ